MEKYGSMLTDDPSTERSNPSQITSLITTMIGSRNPYKKYTEQCIVPVCGNPLCPCMAPEALLEWVTDPRTDRIEV